MSGILRRRGNIYKEVLRAKCTFQDILVRRQGRFQRLSVRASTRRIGTGNRSRMQLISMNALCDNDSTLKEEESSFSGPIWPPKPSVASPLLAAVSLAAPFLFRPASTTVVVVVSGHALSAGLFGREGTQLVMCS